ncbi:DUF72 domain-containing protein [Terrimonas alba]|uniref:DUF72 domain-containing protein n=1 Tax=Terrimonas alba TaxID=3349636 RepID=UPI0035F3C8B2
MKWYIGCSGYHYKDWKEIFYPIGLPQRKWFEYYSSYFDTLELNVTFYRFPQLKFLENWYAVSPRDFRFSVKVPRLITHYKQFNDCDRLLTDFYETTMNGLKEKLGAVLFQLPPSFSYSPERFDVLIKSMQKGFQNVIEFRHASWWNKEVFANLKKEKIIFAGISYPSLPEDVIANHKVAYYRFHGKPKLYYSSYPTKALKSVADSLSKEKLVKEVYVYFNNTATIAAIKNALWLKKYLKQTHES